MRLTATRVSPSVGPGSAPRNSPVLSQDVTRTRGRRRRTRVLGAPREVFPTCREQRCWFHKISNVLSALPKSAHAGAEKALAEIWNAEDRRHTLDAVTASSNAYGAKFPKAAAKITDDVGVLLAVYDFPAEHWIHLRTTNPIWSTFATVRHRPTPSDTERRSPVDPARGRPGWQWRSNSSKPPRTAGAR